uniref:Uncharacterized protein n=1 Tax=Graphocephala atropunctata TaxID=36148 RepID=A0A1B6MMV5_9HEMI
MSLGFNGLEVNEINGLDINDVCRLCGSEEGIRVDIFEPGAEHVKKIHKILPITVNEYDPFPKNMCHRCSFKVNEFYEFRVNCIKAQEVFKNKVPWLRNRKVQSTSINNDLPPMVELPLDPINSISPNEKQIFRKSTEENNSTIIIDDDSPPYSLSNSATSNENNVHHEKIIMKIKKSNIKKKSKRRSIWDIKKRKRNPNKAFKIAEVFTTSLNEFNDVDENNSPLQSSSDEKKKMKTEIPGTNFNGTNHVLPEDKTEEQLKFSKYILVTNIPRVGNVYTCEKCGRTFLSPQPASLHVCHANSNEDNR